MAPKKDNLTFLPDMIVYVRDDKDVWVPAKVSKVSEKTCTVVLHTSQVKTKIS